MNMNHNSGHTSVRAGSHPSLLGKGNTTISLISKSKQKKTENVHTRDTRSDYNLVAPIRQTASIFKQPVTVYKDHKSKVKADLKSVSKEKPAQLFWAKRLGNLNPAQFEEMEQDTETSIHLPKKVEIVGPGISEKMLLASISTHLHLSKEAAYGQKESMGTIDKNPTAFINPHQPLMSKMTVSDDDIAAAEARVKSARIKLSQAIKALS